LPAAIYKDNKLLCTKFLFLDILQYVGLSCRYNDLTGRGVKQVCCTVGDVTFTVKSGNIVEENCDAIVNSTSERLDL